MPTKNSFPRKLIIVTLTLLILFIPVFTAYPVSGDTLTDTANESITWEVNNLTTWADAHYGITQGGDSKTHIITIWGNVVVPPTVIFTNTFGSVKNITIILQGTGIITTSGNGYLLRIGSGQTVIIKDLVLQ